MIQGETGRNAGNPVSEPITRRRTFYVLGTVALMPVWSVLGCSGDLRDVEVSRDVDVTIPESPEIEGALSEPLHGATELSAEELEFGRTLLNRALEFSRRTRRSVVVIDKSAYRLRVGIDGELVDSYTVELGWSPNGPKESEGDGRTPEGLYHVSWRRDIGQTQFHRALLLDYPNATDRELGRTGGDIEIHGCGSGKSPLEGGRNWTAGCIALSNEDVDRIFAFAGRKKIKVGTLVAIIPGGTAD